MASPLNQTDIFAAELKTADDRLLDELRVEVAGIRKQINSVGGFAWHTMHEHLVRLEELLGIKRERV